MQTTIEILVLTSGITCLNNWIMSGRYRLKNLFSLKVLARLPRHGIAAEVFDQGIVISACNGQNSLKSTASFLQAQSCPLLEIISGNHLYSAEIGACLVSFQTKTFKIKCSPVDQLPYGCQGKVYALQKATVLLLSIFLYCGFIPVSTAQEQ